MFLPEDDRDFLVLKELPYELKTEEVPGGEPRNAIVFPRFTFDGDLYAADGTAAREKATSCDLLIVIPQGYATTRLDSWYTSPRLTKANGENPTQTAADQVLLGRSWQFWSRHLDEHEWRAGIDGLETYLQYVRAGLRQA